MARFLYNCGNCDLYFTHPLPQLPPLDLYNNDYYASWGMTDGQLPNYVYKLKRKNMAHHLAQIQKLVPTGRILEVGSAMGSFLKVAQEGGYDVFGVEVSAQGCEAARSLVGEKCIIQGTVEEANLEENSFDVIFLSDLLEHIPQPTRFLEELNKLLKINGLIYIVTPDPKHWSHKVFGKNWVHHKEEHLLFFSEKSLEWISDRYSYITECHSSSLKYVNIKYLLSQLNHFNYGFLSNAVKKVAKLLPCFISEFLVPVPLGEVQYALRKLPKSRSDNQEVTGTPHSKKL